MPGRKFNYYKFGAFCLIVLIIICAIIFGIASLINGIKYKKTYEYKFTQIGYSKEEEKVLESNLNNENLNKLLTEKYDSNIDDFIKEKYFMFKNLNKYLEYKNNNKKEEYSSVVSIINTEANIEWIDETKDTDTSKKDLMLVNRLYGLSSDYVPESIVDIPLRYAYTGKKIDGSILEYIIDLIEAGKEVGYTFVVGSGYRSYAEQEKIYNSYVSSYGQSEADKIVAKPGHSEYQTGISLDFQPYNKVFEDSFASEEYDWLSKNAYKFGFVLRLPKGEEDITGFSASAWRLRYVGKDAAKVIFDENITFEEYYAFYVIGDN